MLSVNKDITYYFGRLNLIAYYTDKKPYIVNSLKKKQQVVVKEYEWGFFDVDEITIFEENYIYGNLVKYKTLTAEEIVDREKRKTITEPASDRVLAKSFFLLHIKSGLIGYHPIPNKISDNQFRMIFSRLIEEANDNLLINADIQTVNEEVEIIKAIRSFDAINSLFIRLHPSNPNYSHRWKKIDDKMKIMQAEIYKSSYNSNKGLVINEEDEVYEEILMASDGYGKAELYGQKDGKKKIASTEKIPIKAEGPKEGTTQEIVSPIISKFTEILKRIMD